MLLDPSLAVAFLVLASGMQHKTRGALASAFDICTGSLVHALAAAVWI